MIYFVQAVLSLHQLVFKSSCFLTGQWTVGGVLKASSVVRGARLESAVVFGPDYCRLAMIHIGLAVKLWVNFKIDLK